MSSVLDLAAALNHFAPQLHSSCFYLREINTPHDDLLSLAVALLKPESLRTAIRKLDREQLQKLTELQTPAPLSGSDALTQKLGSIGLLGVQNKQLKTLPEAIEQLTRLRAESHSQQEQPHSPASDSAGGSGHSPAGDAAAPSPQAAAPASQWWHTAALATTHCDTLTRLIYKTPVKLRATAQTAAGSLIGVKPLRDFAKQLHISQQLASEYLRLLVDAEILAAHTLSERSRFLTVSKTGQSWLALDLPDRWLALISAAALQTAAADYRHPGIITTKNTPLTNEETTGQTVDFCESECADSVATGIRTPAQYLAAHPLAKPATITAHATLYELLTALGCVTETGYNPVFLNSLTVAKEALQSQPVVTPSSDTKDTLTAVPISSRVMVKNIGLAELPPQQQTLVYLQPDQTLLCPGPAAPPLANTLWLLAEPEQLELASTWRISDNSLRLAIAAGMSPEEILQRLTEISLTGIPQPLQFTLTEMSAAHAERTDSATPLPPGTDTAPRQRIQRDTQADPLQDQLLDRLLPKQLTPLPQIITETAFVHNKILQLIAQKPGGDTITNALQFAARNSITVTVEVTARDKTHSFTLVPRTVGSGRLRGADPQNEVERTIPLSAITSVTVSDSRR